MNKLVQIVLIEFLKNLNDPLLLNLRFDSQLNLLERGPRGDGPYESSAMFKTVRILLLC